MGSFIFRGTSRFHRRRQSNSGIRKRVAAKDAGENNSLMHSRRSMPTISDGFDMRRCGWILLSFTLKKSKEFSIKAESMPKAFNLFEIRGFQPLGTLLMRKFYTFFCIAISLIEWLCTIMHLIFFRNSANSGILISHSLSCSNAWARLEI